MKIYLDQLYADKCTEIGMRMLMAAIVDRTIRDIVEECSGYEKASAVRFIYTDMCRDIFQEIGPDYKSTMNMLTDLHLNKVMKKAISIRR